jgi:ribonuclease E
VAAEPAPAPAPAPVAEPVKPFVLPLQDLHGIAQAAGLEWVNSDAEKIRVVQEIIANEPKPVHVPRERKPVQIVDEGPLVLVETRKDLNQIKLPFEQQAS